MTSGKFQLIWIDQVIIPPRENRQRKDIDSELPELAESISRLGLIHPIIIDENNVLVAGERRISAAKLLGWTHIQAQLVKDLDPLTLHAIELEENVKRRDLSWQEKALAIESYNKLRADQKGEPLSHEELGKELGLAPTTIRRQVLVGAALKRDTTGTLSSADKFSTAFNIVERESARKRDTALVSMDAKVAAAVRTQEDAAVDETPKLPVIPLEHADFSLWSQQDLETKFNFLHCDFPYGVGMHDSDQASGAGHDTYEDTPEVFFQLLGALGNAMDRVVAPSAHLIFWFSMDFYQRTFDELSAMGWRVNPFPLVWYKSDNTGILPDPNRGPRRIYETAFFASRGDRLLVRAKANAFSHPGRDKSVHLSEKPRTMLRHFLEMVVDEYTLMLDPTCGSGNAVWVAEQLKANKVLGLERDPKILADAIAHYVGKPAGIDL